MPFIVGPTGVGKSEIAYRLAKKHGAEILSADAFQVYKGLPVGTAQPPGEWLREVKHHLVAVREPDQPWSAAQFAAEARAIIQRAALDRKPLLVVGGSGFYIQSLIEGPSAGSAPDPQDRKWVLAEVEKRGPVAAHAWLADKDPEAARRLHPNDSRRICRALEKALFPPGEEKVSQPLGAEKVSVIGLERSRENLDRTLRIRTEAMWKGGLLEEAQGLRKRGLAAEAPIWGTIGFSEAISFLDGLVTEEDAKERIFRRTRQYAKRQWTWFKHHHGTQWLDLDGFPGLDAAIAGIERLVKFS